MTDHVQANVVQFYSNLEVFRVAEKYTDLMIECDDTYFRCHRLILASACRFFDSIFAGTYKERKDEHLLIREVSATTLGEVLQFIYTGDVPVTCINICNLFKASKFFTLTGIADLCLKFVQENKMTVNTTLEMYSIACQDKNKTLINLLTQDIADQLKVFARSRMFLEIPFNDFKMILMNKLSSSANAQELSLGAICQWFLHRRTERSVYFDQLHQMINYKCVSADVAKCVISKLSQNQDATEPSVVDPVGCDDFFEVLPRTIVPSELSVKKLRLFIKDAEENSMQICSIDENENCTISPEKISLKDASQRIRTIALDDYLYCVQYNSRSSKKENNQTFCVYASANMRSIMELNAPPVTFGDISLCCGQSNNIYAYNRTLFQPLMKTGSRCSATFTDEEMIRGIYLYHTDLDTWLPVPAMKKKMENACLTVHNGLLYLIGGTSHPVKWNVANFVQTYDYREGIWQLLPSRTNHARVGADCCVFNEAIYVCGGKNCTTAVERYDPKMTKWEVLKNEMDFEMQYHRLISYNDKLWAVGGLCNNSSIQNYPNEITSTVECKGCTSSDYYYYDDVEDIDIDHYYNTKPRYYRHFHDTGPIHHEHDISSTSKNNWVSRDILRELNHRGVILDGNIF